MSGRTRSTTLYRAQSRHGTSQFSLAQHSTAVGTVHQDRFTQHCTLARSVASPPGTSRGASPGTALGTSIGTFRS
eukprot:5170333-Pyramimonas_sp.AAC.1